MSDAATTTRRWSRLPLRIRLVAGFVLAMAVLLCASGAFVYWRVRVDLDTQLVRELDDASDAVTNLLGPDGVVPADSSIGTPAARLHQVLARDGTVLSSGADAGTAPLLDAAQLRRATSSAIRVDLGAFLPGSDRPLRLLAEPLHDRGAAAVLVVAVRRDQRDEALRELLAQLAVAGLLALVVAALIGERLAAAALRPVERFRTQAAALARADGGGRLDVPSDRDDEITRLARTFNDVLDALDRALERERRFVDDASHELRTPLTLLRARVQLLQRGERSVDEHRAGLAELATDIDDLVRLADDLLALGTAGVGDVRPPSTVRLVEALGARLLGDMGVDAAAVPDVEVVIEPDDLRRIVTNLLANARVHGREPVRCTIGAGEAVVTIAVHDEGDGIDPAFAPDATQRFRRAPEARNRPGAGLGLALVSSLVDRYGGTLRICSRGHHHEHGAPNATPCTHPVDGTTVSVLLPITADAG